MATPSLRRCDSSADLEPVEKEIQGIDQKFAKYKKELNERKVLPMLAEALRPWMQWQPLRSM